MALLSVPWLTQLVAGRSKQSPDFGSKQVRVEFWWKSDTGTGFSPECFSFPLSLSFHPCRVLIFHLSTTGVVKF